MNQYVSKSRLQMWRAIIAMIHADGVVTPQEMSFLGKHTEDVPFSEKQKRQLSEDLKTPQDPFVLFSEISEDEDKRGFFSLARAVCWCDGDFDAQEHAILDHLEQLHLTKDTKELLTQSRNEIQEIRLGDDQWAGGDGRRLMGFLNGLMTTA